MVVLIAIDRIRFNGLLLNYLGQVLELFLFIVTLPRRLLIRNHIIRLFVLCLEFANLNHILFQGLVFTGCVKFASLPLLGRIVQVFQLETVLGIQVYVCDHWVHLLLEVSIHKLILILSRILILLARLPQLLHLPLHLHTTVLFKPLKAIYRPLRLHL